MRKAGKKKLQKVSHVVSFYREWDRRLTSNPRKAMGWGRGGVA
jgi:hypothetical protein